MHCCGPLSVHLHSAACAWNMRLLSIPNPKQSTSPTQRQQEETAPRERGPGWKQAILAGLQPVIQFLLLSVVATTKNLNPDPLEPKDARLGAGEAADVRWLSVLSGSMQSLDSILGA